MRVFARAIKGLKFRNHSQVIASHPQIMAVNRSIIVHGKCDHKTIKGLYCKNPKKFVYLNQNRAFSAPLYMGLCDMHVNSVLEALESKNDPETMNYIRRLVFWNGEKNG